MTETPQPHTISERVAAINGVDSGLVRELQILERTATGQLVHGAANGKSPRHWSLERWVLVLGFSGTLLYQVFGLGGEFTNITRDLSSVQETIKDVRGTLDSHIRTHEQEHEEIRRVLPPPRRVAPPKPTFSPNDALRLGDGVEQ